MRSGSSTLGGDGRSLRATGGGVVPGAGQGRAWGARRRLGAALGAAVVCHGAVLWWLAGMTMGSPGAVTEGAVEPKDREMALSGAMQPVARAESAAFVTLIDEVPTGPRVAVVPGSHTAVSPESDDSTHPAPRAEVDTPGDRAATRGGGQPGGTDSWTGREDRENFATEVWNQPDRNRLTRRDTRDGRRATRSPESIARDRERGFGDRTETRRLARGGREQATAGGVDATQPGGPPSVTAQPSWDEADPIFTGPAGSPRPQRVAGRTGTRGEALIDVGDRATESERRGPVRDTLDVPGASNETDPAPIEMTAPRAGGESRGVAGRQARDGMSRRGRGTGSAASRADRERGEDSLTVEARRQHPYFRRMYRRVDRRIRFPRDLALSLRQGEVVVGFTLSAEGAISDLRVAQSSGFASFDQTVLDALLRAAPYGRVPRSILDGRSAIRVRAPYAFRNRLIR